MPQTITHTQTDTHTVKQTDTSVSNTPSFLRQWLKTGPNTELAAPNQSKVTNPARAFNRYDVTEQHLTLAYTGILIQSIRDRRH